MLSVTVSTKCTDQRHESAKHADFYLAEVIDRVPVLLNQLDREQCSVSFGLWDREHWGWKFRDFPLGMLRSSVYPLAMLWRFRLVRNPYYKSPQVLDWLRASIAATLGYQHANGSFDAFCPNEQDVMSTLHVMHGLSEAMLLIWDEVPEAQRLHFLAALRRACDFCLSRDEKHAFVSNHWALFAVTYQSAYKLLGDYHYKVKAEEIVGYIARNQSPDGWYCEYGGPDPGYESLSIFHLAIYWQRGHSARVLESLRRSVEFYAHCVHPDGSVGGAYGSRHTSLYFPGGFEILATEIPMAGSVARFMRDRLIRRNVVTPAVSDTENLPPLCYTYLEACVTPGFEHGTTTALLPCEALQGSRDFPDAQIRMIGTKHYYAVVNAAKGGICRIFDKSTEKIAYEDAGYLVSAGRRLWTSQLNGLGQKVETRDSNEISCFTRLAEIRQELPTPAKFVLLRLLNLTLFRSVSVGNWLRKMIIKRLIMKKKLGPLKLTRAIKFGSDSICFHDRVELLRSVTVEKVMLPRMFTAIHMGSAKYFHPAELDPTPQVNVSRMTSDLNSKRKAHSEFSIYFATNASPRLVNAPRDDGNDDQV